VIRTVYVIQHSHTDIGYTHGQSRITRWHGQYIRQAMDLAERQEGFQWTCETFYPVEQFWKNAGERDRERFTALCRAGRLGLSANYLNFTELADQPLLEALVGRAKSFADARGVPLQASMQADINGCSLAYARSLAGSGVGLLLTCIHPHHGYVPLGTRQALFRWDLGDGRKLLVCHADNYHVGNALGLAPGAEINYATRFSDNPKPMDDCVLEHRLPIYLRDVEAGGWTHDFLVLEVSGLLTDNAPPSPAIIERINRWNDLHGGEVRIQMTTPGELAGLIEEAVLPASVPVYQGDWPDWWGDGVCGDPEAVALFRHAQRERRWLRAFAGNQPACEIDWASLDQSLGLFAEHTFGHSASVSAPWNLLAQQLRLVKLGFAGQAADQAEVILDTLGEALGASAMTFDRPPCFCVVQPLGGVVRDLVELEITSAEAIRWDLHCDSVRVVRKDSGETLPHQRAVSLRGIKVLVDVTLKQGESVLLALESRPDAESPVPRPTVELPEGVRDLVGDDSSVLPASIRNSHVSIEWSAPHGITSWLDAATGRDLLAPGAAPFTILASRLPAQKETKAQAGVRLNLGRNRNANGADWSRSEFLRVSKFERGEHLETAQLEYTLPGCELLQVRLSAWKHMPRVDAEIIMHKQGTWDVENLYLALPFTAGEGSELWVDRGMPIRPWIDQLPGTLADYAGVQDGLAWCSPTHGVAVAQKDSHLIQFGPLEYGVRQLSGAPGLTAQPTAVFAWLMTNYWETNFSPEVGGFYSFRFSILWGADLRAPSSALAACREANLGLRAIRHSGIESVP